MNLSPGKGNTHLEKTSIYQWNFEVDFDPYLIFFSSVVINTHDFHLPIFGVSGLI
jgi:hypothetical protein